MSGSSNTNPDILRREFMKYTVIIKINGMTVGSSKDPIEASSPCKAVELHFVDSKHFLRDGMSAVAIVVCHSSGLEFMFDIRGIKL